MIKQPRVICEPSACNLTLRICFLFKINISYRAAIFLQLILVVMSTRVLQRTVVLDSFQCTGTLTKTLGVNMHGVHWACTLHGNGPQHNQQQAQMKLGIHNLELQQINKQSTCLCYLYTVTHSSCFELNVFLYMLIELQIFKVLWDKPLTHAVYEWKPLAIPTSYNNVYPELTQK